MARTSGIALGRAGVAYNADVISIQVMSFANDSDFWLTSTGLAFHLNSSSFPVRLARLATAASNSTGSTGLGT